MRKFRWFLMAAMVLLFASGAFAQTNTPVVGRGVMTFSVANGGVLHLGGASQTTPTSSLSVSSLLASGIPQVAAKTSFNESLHHIKHADIIIVTAATVGTLLWMDDGSTPTSALGHPMATGAAYETLQYRNSAQALFNFKLYNNSGGAVTVWVYVWE